MMHITDDQVVDDSLTLGI